MNVYDGQRIAAMLEKRGMTQTEDVSEADLIILNKYMKDRLQKEHTHKNTRTVWCGYLLIVNLLFCHYFVFALFEFTFNHFFFDACKFRIVAYYQGMLAYFGFILYLEFKGDYFTFFFHIL